jgi:hypothetical protein
MHSAPNSLKPLKTCHFSHHVPCHFSTSCTCTKVTFLKKILSFFQNCPKIVHLQPNAFRPKLPEAAQSTVDMSLFGTSVTCTEVTFLKTKNEKFQNFFQNCPKIVHRQPNAFRPKLPEVAQSPIDQVIFLVTQVTTMVTQVIFETQW